MYRFVTVLMMKLVVSAAEVVGPEGRTIFDPPRIEKDCKPPKVCATLYFYDAAGEPLGQVKGTNATMKLRNVEKVQLIGTGSYTIFKRKNFSHRGESACIDNNDIIDLKGTAYYGATIVRSVRYKHNSCPRARLPRTAGAPLWTMAATIGIVVLVAFIVVAVMLRRKRSEEELVPTEA